MLHIMPWMWKEVSSLFLCICRDISEIIQSMYVLIQNCGHLFSYFRAVMLYCMYEWVRVGARKTHWEISIQEYVIKSKFARLFTRLLRPHSRTCKRCDNARKSIWSLSRTKADELECHWYRAWIGSDRKGPNQCPPGLATASPLFLFVNTSLFNITI